MSFMTILPWLVALFLLIVLITLSILLGLKTTCKCKECPVCDCPDCNCPECPECPPEEPEPEEPEPEEPEPEEPEPEEPEPEEPEPEEPEPEEPEPEPPQPPEQCEIIYPENVPFENKRIRITFNLGTYYLGVLNDNLVITNNPTNSDYWTYNGINIKYSNTNKALRYVNSTPQNDPNYIDKFYGTSGFIQLFESDGFNGERWNFDGYNFYYAPVSSDSLNYMLTPIIYYNMNSIEYNAALTIAPVSTYQNSRDMLNSQGLVVEGL